MGNLFNLAINDTKVDQAFFDSNLNVVDIKSNMVADVSGIRGAMEVLKPIEGSFLSKMKERGARKFSIRRTFALGDMLMLVPVVRYLRIMGFDPVVGTVEQFREIMNFLGIEVNKGAKYSFLLDGIVEADHTRPVLQKIHRVDIIFRALGMKPPKGDLDWSLDLATLPELDIKGNYICFQGAGSGKMKRLPGASISYIRERFRKKRINVVMIEDDRKTSVKELFTIIAGAKCLICMDSSPLWISHFTRTPVIALLGPSRETERLTRHPLYPEGAVGIALNQEVNCQSCFEQTQRCGGRMDCLNISPERVFELLRPEVERFWES